MDLYQGLIDHIQTQSDQHAGKIVILPSSFQGSPRALQQNFQDAMAIVGKFGKPDIFLTFTCNRKHPDIVANLPAGQKIEHRPDVVARVFKQHLTELLIDITESHVLGMVVAYVYVIEFQKRGLPHCHLLLILSHESKLRVPEDIDKIINAEIPSANTEPHLYEVIRSCMVHGPCEGLNPKSVCMSDGTCSKDYPKTFRAETSMRMDAYPMSRWRDNGTTMKVGQYEVDNRWIVPYSPYFSEKFAAHINVEACTTVKSVKYLFKYIYKGHDCATLEMNANAFDHDEVTNHLDARYLSAPEACWRLFEYELHRHSHTIIRLPVHLPEQQMVYFREGQEQNAVANAATKNTMLTAFFKLNSLHPTAIRYTDLPNTYVWNSSKSQWQPRKRDGEKVIARMYFVNPNKMELYCLRLLLLSIPSPTKYEDLRTVHGVIEPTFRDACL